MASHKVFDAIKVIAWNANSICAKKEEFAEYLIRQCVDVALVSETFLKENKRFKIQHYSTYRKDRVTAAGGTAIFVKRGILHHEILLPAFSSIEANAVILNTKQGQIRIISVYKAPDRPLDIADLDLIFSDPIPTIMAGDLNCKHPY